MTKGLIYRENMEQNSGILVSLTKDDKLYLLFEDLADCYFKCGYILWQYIIDQNGDPRISDLWPIPTIFLMRQAIELELKAKICKKREEKGGSKKKLSQKLNKHDLVTLWKYYLAQVGIEEKSTWLFNYLKSINSVDANSTIFRYLYEGELWKNRKENTLYLDNFHFAEGMIKVYEILKSGVALEEKPAISDSFFMKGDWQEALCYLSYPTKTSKFLIEGEYEKSITGYQEVSDFIYKCNNFDKKEYPLMFLLRNTLELQLKYFIYRFNGQDSTNNREFHTHNLEKLWLLIKDETIEKFSDLRSSIDCVTMFVKRFNELDNNGERFRYPVDKSLSYKINKEYNLSGVINDARKTVEFFEYLDFRYDKFLEKE